MEASVDLDIRFSTEDGGSVEDAVSEYLRKHPLLRPARVYSDCPHASWVEFGTLPASKRSTTLEPVINILQTWAEKKLGLKGEEALKVARSIYHKVLVTGLPPAPYFRPAIYDTLSEVEAKADKWLSEGYSLEDIANSIAERAVLNLHRNGQNYTHELENSIKVDMARISEIVDDGRTVTGDISENVWESAELGRDGKTRPNYQRWSRW